MSSVVPFLMSELKNIWIVSNFYSKDINMKHLLQTISRTFTNDLKKKASLKGLFESSSKDAQQKVNDCVAFLQSWIRGYFDMRAVIEKSNAGSRWEFNRNALFGEIEHFIKIYQDLDGIFQILKEFEHLFGLHVKSLITTPIEVDVMVNKLNVVKSYYMNLDYDPFHRIDVEYWDASLDDFHLKIVSLENETKMFINRCVESLRTPASGIKFMLSIVKMNTRQCLVDHILNTSDNVVKILIAYIGNVEHEFLKHRMNPPIANNKSKFIGSIIWVRALFEELKANVMAYTKVSVSVQFMHVIAYHWVF